MKYGFNPMSTVFMILGIFVVSSISAVAANAQNFIGTNLTPIRDWSSELVFNDVFKRARPWVSIEAGRWRQNKIPIELDQHGWVKRLASGQWVQTYLLTGFKGHMPKGKYRCLYHGSGHVEIVNATVLGAGKGWIDIIFKRDAKFVVLKITKTDPKNYIKDIRVLPLNHDDKVIFSTFRSDFLNRWKPFKAIRFMDWMATNYNTQVSWRERPRTTDFTQGTKNGVALEYLIELANTLKVAPWFCMPMYANDAYIGQFAAMVKKRLDPSLQVYIEYSNEVWNSAFPVHKYAINMGARLGLGKNNEQDFLHFYTQRSLRVFEIWKNVFDTSGHLVRVLSGHTMSIARSKEVLDWHHAYENADAFAIGPYFEARSLRQFPKDAEAPNINDIVKLLETDIESKKELFSEYRKMTQERHLQLIAYEGGQHLVARKNMELNELYAMLNRSPRMYDLYRRYLESWFQGGDGIFMSFSSVSRSSIFGHWGVLEWYDQHIELKSKYTALLDAMSRR